MNAIEYFLRNSLKMTYSSRPIPSFGYSLGYIRLSSGRLETATSS